MIRPPSRNRSNDRSTHGQQEIYYRNDRRQAFGHDKSHPLESIGGYTWIGQIDSTDAGEGRAPRQFKDAVWDIFRGIPKQIGGSSLVPVLTSFEERLRGELEASPGCLTVGLEDFRDDVTADLAREILGYTPEGDSDAVLLRYSD